MLRVLFWGLFRFLALYNDMEYHLEPRLIMSSSSRDADPMHLYRSRTSLGNSMGAEAMEWEILPEDIAICKDPYGRDWQLGTGGFGSVRLHSIAAPASAHRRACPHQVCFKC
jgi:hypothetical protein